ncbi:hypothetical protein [Flavobacterium aurantiibacter]|uniref:Polysaccharide (De)acetylase n=1 Tax=Flavobacterium aurantiibacter TaxID=2023067 RepID=A0A255ZRB1_9FLAO|nr:hypothetical protein [Flavobacterium aurantiibacter]OYQ43951.1 hypothetical protein CHX27_08250 [Flavobacterium aurantiibacter]
MINKLKDTTISSAINFLGEKIRAKVIVFESDDWGSTRMYSKDAYNNLLKRGYKVDLCPYNRNDRIENDSDITELANVLLSRKDSRGNHPIFTMNQIVCNPDFNKIKQSDYSKYYYETFDQTLGQYNDSKNTLMLMKQGVDEKIFCMQLHGREHINLTSWFKKLRNREPAAMAAFENNMFSVTKTGVVSGKSDNLDAFGQELLISDTHNFEQIISQAQQIFKNTWGYHSRSFIAPCYTWHPNLELICKTNGIDFIQGSTVQRIPIESRKAYKKKYHYTGQQNALKQRYLVRNVSFEPTEKYSENVVENALKQIERAFRFRTPAIISSHRLNYIGSLQPKNREKNLVLLNNLLEKILKKWPDVVFLSTVELGQMINKEQLCAE